MVQTSPIMDECKHHGARRNADQTAIADLNTWLDHQGLILHDLRKQVKHLR